MNKEELTTFDLQNKYNGIKGIGNRALLKQRDKDPIIRLEKAVENYTSSIPFYGTQTDPEIVVGNAIKLYEDTKVPDLSPELLSMGEDNKETSSGNRAIIMLICQRTVDGLYRYLIEQTKNIRLDGNNIIYDIPAWIELKKYTQDLDVELINDVAQELKPIDGVLNEMQNNLRKWHIEHKEDDGVKDILPELLHYIFTLNELARNEAILSVVKKRNRRSIDEILIDTNVFVARQLYADEIDLWEKRIEHVLDCKLTGNGHILPQIKEYKEAVFENN
ncbi:MAG: hypothetical protein ABIG84_07080 [archaeon]